MHPSKPFFALFALSIAGPLFAAVNMQAQSSEKDITARLTGKPQFLRGFWGADKLKFDESGQPAGNYQVVPFTLAGMDVDNVSLHGSKLHVEGQRVGITFDRDGTIMRVPLTVGDPTKNPRPERISVEIDGHGKDWSAALNAVFADTLADLIPAMPVFWQRYAQLYFVPQPADDIPSATKQRKMVREPGAETMGRGMQRPKPLHTADPEFSETARRMKYSGNVMVYLWVDENGDPTHISIARPAGIGLDEKAVEAVGQYRFSPAMRDGQPVKVDLYIDVNFQIF